MICRTCASLVKFAMQILSGFQVGNQKQKQFCLLLINMPVQQQILNKNSGDRNEEYFRR